jgi:hypothetical protein
MTIKSVGVKWGKYTRQEIQDFLDWCVERGAEPCEGLKGTERKFEYEYGFFIDFEYFGVSDGCKTFIADDGIYYDTVVDTIEEAKGLIDPSWRMQVTEGCPPKDTQEILEKHLVDFLKVTKNTFGKDCTVTVDDLSATYDGTKVHWGVDQAECRKNDYSDSTYRQVPTYQSYGENL